MTSMHVKLNLYDQIRHTLFQMVKFCHPDLLYLGKQQISVIGATNIKLGHHGLIDLINEVL